MGGSWTQMGGGAWARSGWYMHVLPMGVGECMKGEGGRGKTLPQIWKVSRQRPKLGLSTCLQIFQVCSHVFLSVPISKTRLHTVLMRGTYI